MCKTIIKSLILAFVLCFSMAGFAAGVEHKVGFIEGTNLVDGGSDELGKGNKSVQLGVMFYGEMALAGITDDDVDKYKEIYDSLNPTVQAFIKSTSSVVIFTMNHFYDFILLGGFVGLIALAIKAVLDSMSGNFIGNYKLWKLIGVPFFFITITAPVPYYQISVLSYAQLWFNNVGIQKFEQSIITNVLAVIQRGAIDSYKTTLNSESPTKAIDKRINEAVSRKQLSAAENLVNSAYQKAILFTRSSQIRNSYFNNSFSDGKVFDKPSDVMKLEDEYYYIEMQNPENPDENVFSLTPIRMNNALFNLTTASSAMNSIHYATTYALSDSIDDASSIAKKMDDELKAVGFEGDEAKYRTVKNTALNMLFIDIRANWIRKQAPKLMDEAQDMAVLALNAMCADNQEARDDADRYIKSGGKQGSVECLGSDRKVMGTQSAKSYLEPLEVARKAQIDKLYNQIMALNTAFASSMQMEDMDRIYAEIIDCGAICFIPNFRMIRNKTAFTSNMMNQFSQGGFATFSDLNALGDFAMTDYYKDKAGFRIKLQLPVEAFLKKQLGSYTKSSPNLDSDELIQKAIVRNGVTGIQENDITKAQNDCLKWPDMELRKMIMSDQDTIRSFYMFNQGLLRCGTQLVEVSLGIKLGAFIGSTIVNSKESGTKGMDTAQVGKVSNKGKASGFDFSGLFSILDSIADFGLQLAVYLILAALVGMFLVLVTAQYLPLILYVMFRFYTIISPIFITFNAVTAMRSNDDNNFERIRNNVIATLLMPVIAGPAIIVTFIFGAEIAEVVCKGAMEMFFMYGAVQLSGNSFTQYAMLILTLVITFYTVHMTTLAVTIHTLANILDKTGLAKHIPFVALVVGQLNSLTNFLNALSFFMFSFLKSITGFLSSSAQKGFKMVNPFKRKKSMY